MSVLTTLFQDFTARLCSTEFIHDARHTDHPTALSRRRKLPLATLVAIMRKGMRMSIQAELDTVFAHLRQQAQLVHEAYEQARAKLSLTAHADAALPDSKRVNHAYAHTALKPLLYRHRENR
ncbi:hypothetical protein [Janthinobacterium sp. PC23-8]|uniref:hypothetical protein n=1 Tax=Janthinobacterium sp. PC23-8 TaxID=2012679 RepID=UPI0020CD803B|nr:hypothetical protein [Janthinobacterium sp. PC23-8]